MWISFHSISDEFSFKIFIFIWIQINKLPFFRAVVWIGIHVQGESN